MKAAVLRKPETLEVTDIPRFDISEDEVSLKVDTCGICGSDIRYYHGENPWSLHTLGEVLPNPPNIVLGHEFTGTVTEVASKRNEHLLGKRVAVLPFKTCGRCYECKTGRENLCKQTIHLGHGAGWGEQAYYPGGMAEHAIAWANACYELPETVLPQDAAVLDVLGVGVHAVGVARLHPGETVAVFGAGPIGSAIIQVAKASGAGRIMVTDVYPKALDIAQQVGADVTVDARTSDIVETIREITKGFGCHTVFDTVGSLKTFQQGLAVLSPSGTLVNMAAHSMEIPLKMLSISSERKVVTSSNYLLKEFQIALNLVAAQRVTTKPWFTHRFSLEDVGEAFRIMDHKERHNAFKILIWTQYPNAG